MKKEQRRYDVYHFLKKFEAIPDDKWRIHRYGELGGACCALGHCFEFRINNQWDETEESRALYNVFKSQDVISSPQAINDGQSSFDTAEYNDLGTHPKERIINALLLVEAGLWAEAHHGTGAVS